MKALKLLVSFALGLGLLAWLVAPAAAQDEEAGSIAEVAADAGDFATLLLALDAVGLAEMFSDCEGGPYTVFAPTDAAFAAALGELDVNPEDLLANPELLTSILTYHVVEGAVPAADVVGLDGQEVPTVNGAAVVVGIGDGDAVTINDVNVVATDIQACNGIIHVLDNVLVPPGTLEALGLEGEVEAAEEEAAEEEAAELEAVPAELADTGVETGLLAIIGATVVVGGLMVASLSRRGLFRR